MDKPKARPRSEVIVAAVDFVDLQAGFARVNRHRAERILANWSQVGELTDAERDEVLSRYTTEATP